MNLNGGVVNIYTEQYPDITPGEAFEHFILNSNIQIFSSGTYGMIFKATLNAGEQSRYEKFEPLEGYSELREMLIKITFLKENNDPDVKMFTFVLNGQPKHFEASSIDNFRNETNIHVDIHAKSFDYGMPLCPSIVFSSILSETSQPNISDFFNIYNQTSSFNDNGITSKTTQKIKIIINKFIERKQITQIGIIAMEFASDYHTLHNITHNKSIRTNEKQICIDMALYTLIELYKLGYTHGDHHAGNILINMNYNGYFYQQSGRPLIIDFGRTQLLSETVDERDLVSLNELYKNHNYTEILKLLNSIKAPIDTNLKYSEKSEDFIDLKNPKFNHLYGYATGKYNLITGSTRRDFADTRTTNNKIYDLLYLHKTQLDMLLSSQELDHDELPERRKPIYPIDTSHPKERSLSIYDIHIGGISNKKRTRKGKIRRRRRKKTKKVKRNT